MKTVPAQKTKLKEETMLKAMKKATDLDSR